MRIQNLSDYNNQTFWIFFFILCSRLPSKVSPSHLFPICFEHCLRLGTRDDSISRFSKLSSLSCLPLQSENGLINFLKKVNLFSLNIAWTIWFVLKGTSICFFRSPRFVHSVYRDRDISFRCSLQMLKLKRLFGTTDWYMDSEELSNFWARFQIAFSWDYPDGMDIQSVQTAVFHVVGNGETR